MYMTIARLFEQTVAKFPKKEALVDVAKGYRLTYEQWDIEVNKLANALLSSGVQKGDRVSTYLFNTSELATALIACAKIGAIFNPINFRLQPKEVAYILSDAEPKVVLFEQALEPHIFAIHEEFTNTSFWYINEDTPSYAVSYDERLKLASLEQPQVKISEDDLYAIMYTSGTTGRPKGVLHRHRDMVEQSIICLTALKITDKDRGLVTAPMFHCAELHCCFIPRIHVGATNVILHHFDPQSVLKTIEVEKISVLFAAPTMWNMLLQEQIESKSLTSLRLGLYGAAPMAPVLVKSIKEIMGIDLIQAYGMTEMGPAVSFLMEDEQLLKAGSAGRACINHEIRIVLPNDDGPADPENVLSPGEVGEIIVRGPCMMEGYFNRTEASDKAMYKGWYHSGDLGYLDQGGYLYVADRVDDMIISGGENVYPREIEDVLHAYDGVLDVAVLGEPDEVWGEKVIAVIVKKNPQLTAEMLEDYLINSDQLANYKRPRKYVFIDALPRNASGKIQKFLLREQMTNTQV
ncbi:fatty acid--CoA ligase [Cytobacillus sp. IB215665]|uniref:fatty acid--CoA ligase n=1 Tax=Cytobacillus sp. IB215665 TaxID=3097357 RepID=UPI002A0C07E6|nr:fatty acid--CoA ligase [Cytobacillus sp. IB215665]MDX8364633.1 fatty acid--CoA ligase [Cytobacillus sp. IB215665]